MKTIASILIASVIFIGSVHSVGAQSENDNDPQKRDFVLKEVRVALADAEYNESYNHDWIIGTRGAALICTFLVTILTTIAAASSAKLRLSFHIVTAVAAASATVLAGIPIGFDLVGQQEKYGVAAAELGKIQDDLQVTARPLDEILSDWHRILSNLHTKGIQDPDIKGQKPKPAATSPDADKAKH